MKIFIFFNCDANKSEPSMNLFYNKLVYRDTAISRRKLFSRIQSELKIGRIQIAEENLPKIEQLVMSGNPVDASNFILYGAIREFECV